MDRRKTMIHLRNLIALLCLLAAGALLAACTAETTAGDTIQPGEKVAGYLISTAEPQDFLVTSDHCVEGEMECTLPVGTSLNIGYGVVGFTSETLDANWEKFSGEMYINDLPVDLAAFGSIDTIHPATRANSIRLWNVTVEDPAAGELTLRWVTSMDGEEDDETFKIFFK